MADQLIPATLAGIAVVDTEGGPAVRLHLEAKKADWADVELLADLPGVTVLPDGAGVLLNPAAAAVVLKGAEAKPA